MSLSLFQALENIQDPRAKRGIRHPLAPILKFVVWGFASGLVAVEHMVAYGKPVWNTLGKELGFSRPQPPDPTTIRRAIGAIDQRQMQAAFQQWIVGLVKESNTAAVDGKALQNVSNENGHAQMMLSVFAHNIKVTMARYPIEEGSGEATTLRKSLQSLFEVYPGLTILTGDAAYAGRPLCEAIIQCGKHYLFQVKKNQHRLRKQMETWFESRVKDPPAYEEKKERGSEADLGGKWDPHQTDAAADPLSRTISNCLCEA